jgi:hypothetical protein
MIVMNTNAKIMAHVLTVCNRTLAVACLASKVNFARKKYNFAERISIHAQTAQNALTITHITLANVRPDFEELIAPRILMTAKITCAKMVVHALTASIHTIANVQRNFRENSAKAHR